MCKVIPLKGGVLQGVVVAVLGFAELVEEEDDRLEAEHEHNATDETGSIECRCLWCRWCLCSGGI